jgi:acyl-CoA thioester hydrolase
MRQDYFPLKSGEPPPLQARAERRVRFEEVDLLGMAWHGRYAGYFEDGRMAFGRTFGLTYHSFRDHATLAPVVQFHVDYRLPLRFDEEIVIVASLHWSEAARLNFSYRIVNGAGETAASGYTVQLFTTPDGTALLLPPSWLLEFRRKWQQGVWP